MSEQRVPPGAGGEGSSGDADVPFPDDVPTPIDPPEHVTGMLMLSFGAVHPGRERHAVEMFSELARFLGRLVAEDRVGRFTPVFYADGQEVDVVGFFLIEGHRDQLDALRRTPEFVRAVLRMGTGTANVRVNTMIAGAEAGRLVNLYRDVRAEAGLL